RRPLSMACRTNASWSGVSFTSIVFRLRERLDGGKVHGERGKPVKSLIDMRARKYWISGQVQGVGYRYFAIRVARELGLNGWVRNLSDGRVEAYAAGPARLLEDFEALLRLGPPAGEVRGVQVEDAAVDARIEGFDIRSPIRQNSLWKHGSTQDSHPRGAR